MDGDAADAMVDFSHLSAVVPHARWCAANKVALVLGTTGLSPEQQATVDEAASETTVFQASNFSIGVALLASGDGVTA